MKLGELAARLDCKLEGDANAEVRGVAGIESARAGEVTFLSNPKYSPKLSTTLASAVFVGEKTAINRAAGTSCPVGTALGKSLFRFRASHRPVFLSRSLSSWDSPDGSDRGNRENRRGRAHRPVLFRG